MPFLNDPHRYLPLLFVFQSGPLIVSAGDMCSETIDFISAYCDRWCERSAFTERCSAFACDAAIAMCGDGPKVSNLPSAGLDRRRVRRTPRTAGDSWRIF